MVVACLAGLLLLAGGCGESGQSEAQQATPAAGKLPFAWPPKLDRPYPDLKLIDQTGQRTALSAFRGKVVLLEVIGMSCPACNAFAGARKGGLEGFGGVSPQRGLGSIEGYAKRFARVSLDDERVVYVQLLLYDMKLKAPSPEDGKRWARHFGMDRKKNQVVLVGDARFVNKASYDMIPGFHLIDRQGVLRADSSGHKPKQNLYEHLLPLMGKLVRAQKK